MNKFCKDYIRFSKKNDNCFIRFFKILKNYELRYLFYLRKEENAKIMKFFWHFLAGNLGKKYGLLMDSSSLGAGFLFAHGFNITVNKGAKIGQNVTIFKGVTIGSIRGGVKAGYPKIGNRVTICANAMVCSNITIEDDVLIAANAFVNFDVPSNSIVIGNPGAIHKANNPSKYYL